MSKVLEHSNLRAIPCNLQIQEFITNYKGELIEIIDSLNDKNKMPIQLFIKKYCFKHNQYSFRCKIIMFEYKSLIIIVSYDSFQEDQNIFNYSARLHYASPVSYHPNLFSLKFYHITCLISLPPSSTPIM